MKPSITYYLVAAILMLFSSCNYYSKKKNFSFIPKTEHVTSTVILADTLITPFDMKPAHLRVIPAGSPTTVITNKNVKVAGTPESLPDLQHDIIIPGVDGCPLPTKTVAVQKKIKAKIPEVAVAESAGLNEKYPQDFSFFEKLQGLTGNNVTRLCEDKRGNLWIGTDGSGVNVYDGRTFTHLMATDGLGANFVRHIVEDMNGNMWFGMLNKGISSYDGINFTNYTVTEGLSNNWVTGMVIDKKNRVCIGTIGGLNVYDGRYFMKYGNSILGTDTILTLMKDSKGRIWISTPQSLINWDGQVFNRFSIRERKISVGISALAEDLNGNIWGATPDGLLKFDGSRLFRYTKSQGLFCHDVTSLEVGKEGNIWMGYDGGPVTKYDGKTMTHFRYKDSLKSEQVRDILEDRRGNLWIGVKGGGLNRYSGKKFDHFTVNEGLNSNTITGILGDSGNLWFSTLNGVSKYDQKSFGHLTYNEGVASGVVWAIMKDHKNNFWFATNWGVNKYDGKTFTTITANDGLGNNDVKCLLEDRRGNIWFGTMIGLTRYDGSIFTRYPMFDSVSFYSILEDKSGHLWFGTSEGLMKYDGRNFTKFTIGENCGNNGITCIIQDNRGFIWFGTGACGLLRYDDSACMRFDESNGLASNAVVSLMEDKSGNIWCGTVNGISRMDRQKILTLDAGIELDDQSGSYSSLFKSYSYDDGFLGQGVLPGRTMYETDDGTIWIGANGRLTAFHPKEMHVDSIAPNIQLTGISLFNEHIPWQSLLKNNRQEMRDTSFALTNGKTIHDIRFDTLSRWYHTPGQLSLAYDNNFITFQFVGITIQSPKKVRYAYKLEGFDNDWSTPSDRNEATYGNLSHGNYQFKVKAMNDDGYWSSELSYPFIIRAPWWHTWWAYSLFSLSFISFIYALYRYRVSKIHAKHELVLQKHKTAELEMQALRAQMNPHFVFNSLNSINHFILDNNRLQASEYLAKFSRLVRLILHNSDESLIALERELEALRLYLELESLRFQDKFTYQINIEDGVDAAAIEVPPLIIQPYVENAIWHGLMHKEEAGRLEINLYRQDKLLCCEIADDGVGRDKAAQLRSKSALGKKSVGMRITANRLAILQKDSYAKTNVIVKDVVLTDGKVGGTVVLLSIPLIQ